MAYKLDKVKVLLVDDMKPFVALTKSVLNTFGFENVLTASNGEDAFEIVRKEDPDFILTDWIMEPMDGIELTKKIRTAPGVPNPYVPIIMMTGFSSKLRVETARDHGVTEFLVKPFTAKDLYTRVFQIIEKPRQFVSAGEFFGPDRRRRDDREYEGPRRRGADSKRSVRSSNPEASDLLKKLSAEAKQI